MKIFKTIIIVVILLLIASVGFLFWQNLQHWLVLENKIPENVKPEVTYALGSVITLQTGQQAKLADGLIVLLKEINDSRCKPGVVCIWAGELSPVLLVSGGKIGSLSQEVTFGTLTVKKITKNGYTFELQEATPTMVTITISNAPVNTTAACYVGGCSGQICSDQKDVITTCEYKEEYACYKTEKCEKQSNGQCGWTQTPVLVACINGGVDRYACNLPCTGAAPDPDLGVECSRQASEDTCNSVKSDKFPYACQWRPKDYRCPLLP